MSGGEFDYKQYGISEIADAIEAIIALRNTESYLEWSDQTQAELVNGLEILRKAFVYAQRIDWFISGDDGEDYFHSRLKEDLEKYIGHLKCGVSYD